VFFIKRLGSKEICEDLTSEVFYSCYKNFNKYDPAKASLSTWIFVIANNKLKNYYRDKKESVSIDDCAIVYDVLYDKPDLDGAIYLTQMKIHLTAALGLLSQREQTVVELRYFSELTSDKIAEEIGTTAINARVLLTRALKKLAKYFEHNGIRWDE
jgi:RNA polymerase sigma-70 factor (ECF subfamily)